MRFAASLIFMLSLTIANANTNTMVILGDSLSASYGILTNDGWVNLFKARLKKSHPCYQVINLSTSGDTSVNGLIKLKKRLFKINPTSLVIELGANDALRGIPLNITEKNLRKIIQLAKNNHIKTLLVATRLPPNYGKQYLKVYEQMFKTLSESENIPLIPMMLKNVAENTNLMQKDGLHPKKEAQPIILDNLWPELNSLLTPC